MAPLFETSLFQEALKADPLLRIGLCHTESPTPVISLASLEFTINRWPTQSWLRAGSCGAGPRPHAAGHNELYKSRIPKYMRRRKVKPGITGRAQANGLRGQTDTPEKMALRIQHDLWYIFRTGRLAGLEDFSDDAVLDDGIGMRIDPDPKGYGHGAG